MNFKLFEILATAHCPPDALLGVTFAGPSVLGLSEE